MAEPVELGKRYRDTLTGWEGVATMRATFLYGCVRVEIEGVEDGKPEGFMFDEQRLVSVETNEPVATTARAGGARSRPSQTGLQVG